MGLNGKRVLVTRAKAQAASLVDALVAVGAKPVAVPVIRIAPPADPEMLARAVARVNDYDWLVFTSVNGVEVFFAERSRFQSKPIGAKIAAIGPSTAEALRAHGVTAEVIPDEYRGEAVAEAIRLRSGASLREASILLPRAAGAREALPEMLREAGARVDVVEAYRVLAPQPEDGERLCDLLQRGEIDVATFTSSSTVSNTVAMLGAQAVSLLTPLVVASIGPITTETAKKHSLRVDVTASEYTIQGLVAALQSYFLE
jgi:uroporphyrinogen III methyltransferase/synthase